MGPWAVLWLIQVILINNSCYPYSLHFNTIYTGLFTLILSFVLDPSVSITCNPNSTTVALEKKKYHFLDASQLHLRYASCRATENSTNLLISTPLNACGTSVKETEHVLTFENKVKADKVIINNITRTHDVSMPFSCSYSRKTLLSLGFTPISIHFGYEGISRASL